MVGYGIGRSDILKEWGVRAMASVRDYNLISS